MDFLDIIERFGVQDKMNSKKHRGNKQKKVTFCSTSLLHGHFLLPMAQLYPKEPKYLYAVK